ncbi:hypothetical protein [Flagellimonas sp.]|uniref:hypothetical protein n=1 Tax=Flagellimonas sp. TaxID=2058762 RepID=UPI003F49CE1E
MLVLYLLTILCLCYIVLQDFKERQVYWFLFPLLLILLITIHSIKVHDKYILFLSVVFNFLLVSTILLILYLYTRLILKRRFVNYSLGLGDILFFYAFASGFPILTFSFLFVFSIFFSLLFYLIFKKKLFAQSIPLAGLMGIFLASTILLNLLLEKPLLHVY